MPAAIRAIRLDLIMLPQINVRICTVSVQPNHFQILEFFGAYKLNFALNIITLTVVLQAIKLCDYVPFNIIRDDKSKISLRTFHKSKGMENLEFSSQRSLWVLPRTN